MQKRGSGSIVNIASIHGMIGPNRALYEDLAVDGFLPDYFFHKGGVINFTRFVASYYGPSGVRCNCISPGGIESANTNEELRKRYSVRPVLRRMGSPADLVGATIFLASEASLYVTGTNLVVDGGYTST
jgi:NAD(P)-dependent dehydrogenase (short-subunit alcohol dehydrogenase family)